MAKNGITKHAGIEFISRIDYHYNEYNFVY